MDNFTRDFALVAVQADAHVFDWALAQVAEDGEDDEDDLVLLALADALGVTIDRFADV
jgi:hypothetical protein